jgi:predicted transcriptional regulator
VIKQAKATIFLVLLFLFSKDPAFALIPEGTRAPEFTVKSGDDKELTLKDLEGMVVVLFYETGDEEVEGKNRTVKKELNRFYGEQTDEKKSQIARVIIIDCREAFWPFKGIWKRKLREHSKKEGITFYGDWDGSFAESYDIAEGDSNLLILDKKGNVRLAKAGKIEESEIPGIQELLEELVRE